MDGQEPPWYDFRMPRSERVLRHRLAAMVCLAVLALVVPNAVVCRGADDHQALEWMLGGCAGAADQPAEGHGHEGEGTGHADEAPLQRCTDVPVLAGSDLAPHPLLAAVPPPDVPVVAPPVHVRPLSAALSRPAGVTPGLTSTVLLI